MEGILADKSPQRLYELLGRYTSADIAKGKNRGEALFYYKLRYYKYRTMETDFEETITNKIGQMVEVRFRAAWSIYFRYFLLRSFIPRDEIMAAGNFLNYDITWDSAEKIYAELSSDKSISQEMNALSSLRNDVVEEARKILAAVEQ